MSRGPHLLFAALTLASAARAGAAQGFGDLVARKDAGDLAGAYALADEFEDGLLAAQGKLYVRYHAGDLAGAFSAGLAGLSEHPGDLWLLERSARLALDLSAVDAAQDLAQRLRDAALTSALSEDERAAWLGPADEYAVLASEHLARLDARDAALGRARGTVLAFSLAAGALLAVLLWLGPRRVGLTST